MKKENARNATNAGLRDTSKETVPNWERAEAEVETRKAKRRRVKYFFFK